MTQTTFANGINPFDRLGKLPPQPTMQKPPTPIKQEAAPAAQKPAKKPQSFFDPAELSVTNDPLPPARAAQINKYNAVFEGMKLGQSVRCPSASVGKVSGAMRKFVEQRSLNAHVKSMVRFEDDTGYGRIWMMKTPAKALKVAA